MRTPNILRDQIYGIVANQGMDPAAKAAAIRDAGMSTGAGIAAPSVQMPASTMALPDAPTSPSTGAFSRALAAQYSPTPPPLMSGQPSAVPPASPGATAALPDVGPSSPPLTAAFQSVNAPPSAAFPAPTAPPDLGDEINRRSALTLAALGTPTTYPTVR